MNWASVIATQNKRAGIAVAGKKSQRDFIIQPSVDAKRLRWVANHTMTINSEGVES